MNWFSILKTLAQSQRQGFRLDDKDEDYVLEDESDCYDEFVRIYENIKNFFPNAIREPDKLVLEGAEAFSYAYDKFVVYSHALIPKKGEIPDELFCKAIETYKNAKYQTFLLPFEGYSITVIKNHSEHSISIYDDREGVAWIALDAWEREFIDGAYGPPSSAQNIIYNIDQNIDGWRGSLI